MSTITIDYSIIKSRISNIYLDQSIILRNMIEYMEELPSDYMMTASEETIIKVLDEYSKLVRNQIDILFLYRLILDSESNSLSSFEMECLRKDYANTLCKTLDNSTTLYKDANTYCERFKKEYP